jgi:hypothetical protein
MPSVTSTADEWVYSIALCGAESVSRQQPAVSEKGWLGQCVLGLAAPSTRDHRIGERSTRQEAVDELRDPRLADAKGAPLSSSGHSPPF